MKPSRNIRADSGFSIIELSIILVVLAFVLTNMLLITENKRETTRSIDTYQKMDRLQETLTQYVKAKGHYPCPADGRARINTDTYGRGLGTGTGTCQTMEENPALGIFRVKDTAYANGFNDMVIGVVPTVDLALPSTYGVDQWGSRITYGVIQRFTKKGDYAATMDGDIKILNEDGTLNSKSAYVLVSHGPNAVGAWPFAGGTNAGRIPSPTSPPTYIGAELENHHMDTNQFDKEFFRAGKPDPNAEGNDILFDDIVRYQVPEQYYGQDTSVDGKAFSPESIPGLVLWLDAKDKENIDMNTSNSNNVMTWKDRTSIFNNSEANDAVTVTNGQRPTYRKAPVGTSPTPGIAGKPAITFSQGSNDVLKIVGTAANNSLSFDTPYNKAMTLFFVAKSTEGLADQSIKTMFSKETIGASPLGWGLGSLETANNLFGFHIGDPTDD
ncbi:MAG: hypothetical protein EB060_08460, partial [Proteobacteria bacterium]|nr:hypothetical protein [Pseudomonadota bacterium]